MIYMEIKTDNAAFEDSGTSAEVARILRDAADRIERFSGRIEIGLYDSNGNHVGYLKDEDS